MDELIVYLILKTGWTLEYATELVKNLDIKKLNALVAEMRFQDEMAEYRNASNFAMILATYANSVSKGRRYRVKNFIGEAPRRDDADELTQAAQKEGIKLG
jgi:hypothetical protein